MRRMSAQPRPDHLSRLEALGLSYHTHENGDPYWREGACYAFSLSEIERLEKAANEVQALCLQAVDYVIAKNRFSHYGIPDFLIPAIRESWERDEVSIYGRFDFAYDGIHHPKLLEYNADTPTSLVEAAVAQWHWLEDLYPNQDQFNSLHERLVNAWKRATGYLPLGTLYFLYQDTEEDHATVAYLRDTADQAGLSTAQMLLEDLGWDDQKQQFIDLDGREVPSAFKLYPWEFMWEDDYSSCLALNPRPCTFLEPAWKMLLSNKALLAILWELFPDCPYLLPSFLSGPGEMRAYVKKPLLAREGANVEIETGSGRIQSKDFNIHYGAEGYLYQAYEKLPLFEGWNPVLGLWMVDGECAGMGIREADRPITDNRSCFVPHLIE